MKDHFTISEFAKLRNININSLRYYEKLGLLKPAYVDPDTGYRYYSAEQLSILDKIILCINLGIPLKELTKYIDETGMLHSQMLLERGKIEAQKKIRQLQDTMHFIDFSLKSMEDNKDFANKQGLYVRHLDARRVITSEVFFTQVNIKTIVSEVAKLYKAAQEMELFPILPAGQIFHMNDSGNISCRLFLQIMNREKELPCIKTIPSGTYSCMQLNLNTSTNLLQIIRENFVCEKESVVIVDNIILDKYSYGNRPSEIQQNLQKSDKVSWL